MNCNWQKILRSLKVVRVLGVPGSELRTLYQLPISMICAREDEAVATACGLHLGGEKCLVAIQSSGIGNCINVLASLVVAYDFPILLLVSIRAGGREENKVQTVLGDKIASILSDLRIECWSIETEDDLWGAEENLSCTRNAFLCNPELIKKINAK